MFSKLNNTCVNNAWLKQEIKRKNRKYFEQNKMKHDITKFVSLNQSRPEREIYSTRILKTEEKMGIPSLA